MTTEKQRIYIFKYNVNPILTLTLATQHPFLETNNFYDFYY